MSNTIVATVRRKGLLAIVAKLLEQPLFANAGYLLGVYLVSGLAGFIFWGLAARLYRPEDVGTASAILSAVLLLAGLSDMGVGIGLVRFLPEARYPARLLNTAFTFVIGVTLLTTGGYLAGLSLWSPSLAVLRQSALYATGFVAYTVATTLANVVHKAFVARRRAGYVLIQTCVYNGGRLLLASILASLGAVGLVGSATLSLVLAVALSLTLFLPRLELGYGLRLDWLWPDLVAVIPYSAENYFAGLLAQTSQMVLPLMVLEMLGASSSGYAYIAWMLGTLLSSPGAALADSAFAEGSNAPQSLTAILTRSTILSLVLTVPVAIALGAIAPWLLHSFGPDYSREASGLLRWLAVAAPLVVLNRLWSAYLRVRKQVGRLILLSGVVAAITLGVAALWMPCYGIEVGGIGWLVGNALAVAAAAASIWRKRAEGKRWPKSS